METSKIQWDGARTVSSRITGPITHVAWLKSKGELIQICLDRAIRCNKRSSHLKVFMLLCSEAPFQLVISDIPNLFRYVQKAKAVGYALCSVKD